MTLRRPDPRGYPRCQDADVAAAVDAFDDDTREFFEERAAIIEFDGGSPRAEAERAALEQTREWLVERERR